MSSPDYYRVDPTHSGELGRECWILGPPGCGKTTFLAGSVKNTTLLRGRDSVAVCSFTTAAAAEIGGRDTGLHQSQYGTLHSMAKRSLGGDNVVYLEQLSDWNTHHPGWALKGEKRNVDDPGAPSETAIAGGADGDALMTSCENYRSKLVPRDEWPSSERTFFAAWEDWKRANGLIDFTDMIELALDDTEVAPGRPDVLFADEVQDFTPLELALVRKWGQHAERLVLAGDDDQSIYYFRGALPEAWLDQPVADADKIVLSQSWRIPASVHRTAEHWIRKLDRREEKLYKPRDEEGTVRSVPVTFKQQHMLADEIEKSLGTVDSEGNPATVMVLATCAFMVDPIVRELRERGIPFSNPWQRRRGDWNPFPPMGGKNISSRERLLAYLSLDEQAFASGPWHRPEGWTGEDIRRWAHAVKKRGIFARGAAGALEALPAGVVDPEDVMALFADEVEMEQAVTPDLEWFGRNLATSSRNGMAFPLQVARARGAQALLEEPRVHVGTMHSFKGAQATVVYLIPDLSKMFMNDWRERGPGKDSIRRLFYVGMTRARRELAVLAPAERFHVEQHTLVAGSRVGA